MVPATSTAPTVGAAVRSVGTTTLFGLLIAAVLATSSTVFFVLNITFYTVTSEGILLVPLGTSSLLAFAGLLYLAFPWWIKRRDGLRPITEDNCPALMRELNHLCDIAGVAPTFLLAPRSARTGGLAFGRARHRYVKLDAGLVLLMITDLAMFRAVVLHELAHLRNRDVDKAYFTVAIWWSFVVIGVPLMLVLVLKASFSVNSTVRSSWVEPLRVSGSLLALTALVLLIRNALLRSREFDADATAMAWSRDRDLDSAAASLRAMFLRAADRDQRSRLRRLWDDHPAPRSRADAIGNEALLLRPEFGALFGFGAVAAILTENGLVLFAFGLPSHLANVAFLIVAVALGAGATLVLLTAVWRAAAARPDRTDVRVLVYPLVIAAGFVAGEFIALADNAGGRLAIFGQFDVGYVISLRSILITMAPLVIGGMLLAGWASSSAHSITASSSPPRRVDTLGLGAAATLAVVPWIQIWLDLPGRQNRTVSPGLVSDAGQYVPTPMFDHLADWYAVLLRATESVVLWPNRQLLVVASIYIPWIVVGVAALWLVPMVLNINRQIDAHGAIRATTLTDYRRTLWISVAGTLGCAVVIALEFYEVNAAFVLHRDGPDITVWADGCDQVFLATTVLFSVVTATFVAGTVRRQRPILCLLAIFIPVTIMSVANWIGDNVGTCAALHVLTGECYTPRAPTDIVRFWTGALTCSAVCAIGPAIIAAGIASIARRSRSAASITDIGERPVHEAILSQTRVRQRRFTAFATVLLLVVTITASANYGDWLALMTPDATADCIGGTWIETSSVEILVQDDGTQWVFTGSGVMYTFTGTGTGTVVADYGNATPQIATVGADTITLTTTGSVKATYAITDNVLSYSHVESHATIVGAADGRTLPGIAATVDGGTITCGADALTMSSPGTEITFSRKK